ncbi:MAG: hypothetical protein ABT19_03205 [Rhodanobacter sp. SCN 68-63]|nr:MAG: hypothetical protein ABT19_03205 [Rhodanobacter sp. SCN 68-63]
MVRIHEKPLDTGTNGPVDLDHAFGRNTAPIELISELQTFGQLVMHLAIACPDAGAEAASDDEGMAKRGAVHGCLCGKGGCAPFLIRQLAAFHQASARIAAWPIFHHHNQRIHGEEFAIRAIADPGNVDGSQGIRRHILQIAEQR